MPIPLLEDAASVRRLELMTRRVVDDVMAGEYHSVFRGQGMDFSEVREYAPGDDIRTIDWNVTARTHIPHVKRYIEERELTVMFVVDVSGSTAFGSHARIKRSYAAVVTAVLAFSAIRNNDRVGLMLFSDKVEKYIQPRKGKSHGLRVITELLNEPEGTGTNTSEALSMLNRLQRKKSVVFLISDFQDSKMQKALSVTSRRHDLIGVSITDPREITLPNVGLIEVQDAETGQRALVDTSSKRVRNEMEKHWHKQREQAAKLLRQLKIDHIRLQSDRDFAKPLVEFFENRAARLTHA